MPTGIQRIAKEREEQLTYHNRTHGHDLAVNGGGELRQAAMYCLTLDAAHWPKTWVNTYAHKILLKPLEERLVIAGALLAAEIDRLSSLDDYEAFLLTQQA